MTAPDFTSATWHKSSYSGGNGGDCVEIAHAEGEPYVGIRDTKDRSAGHLTIPAGAWQTFLTELDAT